MMQKVLFLAACLSISFLVPAQTDFAISFIDNDFKAALADAKAKDKLIFVDAYADWCGPCKMMDKDVFSDSVAGAFFNTHFVNLKLDLEKGDGPALSLRYGVRAYPTFLFLDSAGDLVHQSLGYQRVERLISLGQEALNPETQHASLKRAYKQGKRDSDFLRIYATSLFETNDSTAYSVAKAYLDTQSNWANPNNLPLIARLAQSYGDPYYSFMVEKRYLFARHLGEGTVDSRLQNLIETHLYRDLESVDLKEAKAIYSKTFPASKAGPYFEMFEINYYDLRGNKTKYRDLARAFVKKHPTLSWSTLNELAWGFYERIDDTKALKWAVKWALKSVTINSNPFNNDTVAALYYKLGNKKKATKYAHHAIELAQSAGADHSETNKLLEKIERMD